MGSGDSETAEYYRARAEGYRKLAVLNEAVKAERFVQVGMRAAIRDMQEFIVAKQWEHWTGAQVNADELEAYLLTMLVTAGIDE